MAPRAITVIAYTLLPFVSPYRYRRNRSWIFSRPFYCYGPCLCRCPDHLLCKQAEIQSKSLFWLRFRISDEAKYVPKMFLLRWAAQIDQRCVPRCNPQPKAGMAYSLRRCFWAFATLRLTAGGYKTLSAAFGVAYEPYRCLSCP